MEFLVISESKLKIILTKEDADRINFTTATADYDTPESRRAFRRILDEANEKVDFSSKGDKILIQFYPSRDGGCEIFVTKLALPKETAKLVSKSENITMLERARTLYCFPDTDALRRFARAAVKRLSPISDAYLSESGACFLDVEENSRKDADEYLYIREFATKCRDDFRYYVREHCELTHKDDAIRMLAEE